MRVVLLAVLCSACATSSPAKKCGHVPSEPQTHTIYLFPAVGQEQFPGEGIEFSDIIGAKLVTAGPPQYRRVADNLPSACAAKHADEFFVRIECKDEDEWRVEVAISLKKSNGLLVAEAQTLAHTHLQHEPIKLFQFAATDRVKLQWVSQEP